jgi:hypothetical protein
MSDHREHRTRWTLEEESFLQTEWDGTEETLGVIAELLGRTVNAVRQRHYELIWGNVEGVRVKPERGATRITLTRTEVTVTRTEWTGEVCNECHTLRSANGACLCNE